jgi:hypothetical protein
MSNRSLLSESDRGRLHLQDREPGRLGRAPDVQRVFPDIKVTMNGESKSNETVGLQLTNKGWEIPGP